MDYSSLTIPNLKDHIRDRGLRNYSGKNKAGLVLMLEEHDRLRDSSSVSSTSSTLPIQSVSLPIQSVSLPIQSVSLPIGSMVSQSQSPDSGVRMVRLRCVKEKNKLRVKIDSSDYIRGANCRFPRDIRVDGREYLVPSSDISLSAGRAGKFFYIVKKGHITQVPPNTTSSYGPASSIPSAPCPKTPLSIKVYEAEDPICTVCMDAEKDTVIVPCGHLYFCRSCSDRIFMSNNPKCPICRTRITQLANRSDIEGE